MAVSYRKHAGPLVKLRAFLAGGWEGIRSITRVESVGSLVFHSASIWACYYFATWTCFFALSSTGSLGASPALGVLVFGSFGMAAPVQGGLGAYHVMAIAALEAYGVAETDATSSAFLIHGSQLLLVILAGSLALVLLPLLDRRQDAR
jgi:uncharacterized membrane protein YbhN (UPF0104 family)